MSSFSLSFGAPAPTHYCHQCQRSVRPEPADDVVCPLCHQGFIEEIASEDPMAGFFNVLQQVAARPPATEPSGNNTTATTTSSTSPTATTTTNSTSSAGSTPPPAAGFPNQRGIPFQRANVYHMIQTMTAMMQQVQPGAQGGGGGGGGGGGIGTGNVEIFFDNGTGPRRFPGNFGDYFFGAEFDQLLQQLAENDPNRYGTPPASKTAVAELPTIKISDEHLGTDSASCAVCKDDFETGTEVKQMPCKHMYHPDCILPWLNQHNSCPVCRFELPTDDADYNQSRNAAAGSASASASGGVGAAAAPGGATRSFTLWGGPAGFSLSTGNEGGAAPAGTGGTGTGTATATVSGEEGNNRNSGAAARRFGFFPWIFGSNTEASGSGGRPGDEEYDSLHDVD